MWDEENRIRAIYDNGAAHHYTYDASGTRVLKGKSNGQAAYVNGEWTGGSGSMLCLPKHRGGRGNYTVYVNPYIVLKSGGYSKHYYIEGQRIVSKLGDGLGDPTNGSKAGNGTVSYGAKQEEAREAIVKNLKFLGQDGSILTAGNSGKTPPGQISTKEKGGGKESEQFQYFYHTDHLGSSSYITDASGEVYQHLEYFAFGETFVEEHSNTDRTPYLFNGKELDEETGLYYYGARYYEPQISVWLSVDPHAENYFSFSPFAYVGNNPIVRTDPDGKDWDIVIDHDAQTITVSGNFMAFHGNDKTVQKAAENWNSQSGKFSYVVGKGDNAVSYSVNFDISVNKAGNGTAENSVQILPDNSKHFQERKEMVHGQEVTIKPQGVSDGQTFAMKDSKKGDSQKTAHEMGHNLGMGHSSGVMGKEGGTNLRKKSVRETLGHSGVGKGVKGATTNATLQKTTTKGSAPTNFTNGKLKRNRDWKKTEFN